MTATPSAQARLEIQLNELQQRLTRLRADLAEPLNADSREQALELEDDAPVEAQAALVTNEIASVQRALDRLADGTYGACVRCGSSISSERLHARPEAALCIDCARQD